MNFLFKLLLIIFFVSHIPITLFLDGQGLFGDYYPKVFKDFNEYYFSTYKDFLIENPPVWLKTLFLAEIFFQLPFFFIVTYCLIMEKNWIRIPAIVYGSHTVTTILPIWGEFICSSKLNITEKLTLIGFYFPYLVIPLTLMIYMCFVKVPFTSKEKHF